MGLDDAMYRTIRSSILSMDPLPNVSQVYVIVQEECHRNIAKGKEERGEVVGFAVRIKQE